MLFKHNIMNEEEKAQHMTIKKEINFHRIFFASSSDRKFKNLTVHMPRIPANKSI
jgi:hypothetical protein